jgi:hypothetical protein
MPDPLPPLVQLSDSGNDGEAYLEELYRLYLAEIVNAGLMFQGLPIHFRFYPLSHGKGFGFWHLIQEGKQEEDRTPDMHRCKRILWVPWVIKRAGSSEEILWWENERYGDTHVVLWLRKEHYVVILAKRKNYYLLISAYVTESPHREQTYEKEWKAYWKKG